MTQHLLFRFSGILKSYTLVMLVVVLMLLQLDLAAELLSIHSILNLNHSFILLVQAQPGLFALYGFIFCCSLWYLYRPLTLTYLYIKQNLIFSTLKKYRRASFSSNQPAGQYDWLQRLSSRISRKLSIKEPKIVIDDSAYVNAKVLPGFIHAPLIVFTQGLLDKLTPDEIEAVLAHELAHVAMQDTYSMSVTDIIILLTVWLPVYVCHIIIDYVVFYKWRDKNIGFIVSLVVVLLMYGFLAFFILNTLNRRCELRADKVAMTLVNMQSFLNALHRVHSAESHIPGALDWCLALMPKVLQKFVLQVFLSHPSIPARIQALQ